MVYDPVTAHWLEWFCEGLLGDDFVFLCSGVSRTRFLGRRASLPTLGHYLQEAAAVGVLSKVPVAARARLKKLRRIAALLSRPPRVARVVVASPACR